MYEDRRRGNRSALKWIILIVIILAINFYQLPYYFTVPGDAKVLSEVIDVEERHDYEGSFMLTTVRMGPANVVNYVWALVSDERELIPENQIRPEGETDDEYHHRQMMLMSSSQEVAVYVAYNHAGETAYFENYGVIVTGLVPAMDAEEKLEAGDRIIEVAGEEVLEAESLLNVLSEYEIGDTVSMTVERGDETLEVDLEVMPFPEDLDPEGERGGVGISYPVTDSELIKDPEISIDTDTIGGPSAGLMFSLEIYNQLLEEDITKGYDIAGTGSIDLEGNVGRIGGVNQKVIASDNAGADFFFAPSEQGIEQSNYETALETAESIGTEMEIVPIDTFEEALEFLENLPLAGSQ
ncbi:SepM family pheromone-processing serine protease [Evansella clarkii]|uniref:SepM family pheromone-processing serine protease n=1 Tax=Evansella clarkii TaxID=79879 RepID=UPI000997A2D5|nr:SepM family pheromone-processing serine protease [Evansella clarkii]